MGMLHKEDFGPSLMVSRPYTPSRRTYRAPNSLHLVGETPTKRPSPSRTRCRYNSTRAGVHKPLLEAPKGLRIISLYASKCSNTSTIWARLVGEVVFSGGKTYADQPSIPIPISIDVFGMRRGCLWATGWNIPEMP